MEVSVFEGVSQQVCVCLYRELMKCLYMSKKDVTNKWCVRVTRGLHSCFFWVYLFICVYVCELEQAWLMWVLHMPRSPAQKHVC